MKFIDSASNRSFWRGYDYYESNMVKTVQIVDEKTIKGTVKGLQAKEYEVEINLDKPRSSTCTCPFSKEHTRSICKHMVAVYFAAYPKEAKRIIDEIEEEEQQEKDALMKTIVTYVNSLSEEQVRKELTERMFREQYEEDDDYFWR